MTDDLVLPTTSDVHEAAAGIAGHVTRTPVLSASALDAWAGTAVRAKAESLQRTGSFKVRGALNRLRTLPASLLDRGLLTVSAGNAAVGAAYAAAAHGAHLTVVMPANAVPEKLAAVRALGATIHTEGIVDAAAAFACAESLQVEQGLTFVHPYDDPMVVAGAATATLELLEDHPSLTHVYVPCSGGGLLAGAVLAVQAVGRQVSVVGVQPAGAASMVLSLEAGVPTRVTRIDTVADGLTAPAPGRVNLDVIKAAGVRIITVTDAEILDAMKALIETLRIVVEPSAATALAGCAADVRREHGSSDRMEVGVLVSGSNVSRSLLSEVLVR